jgi:ABC-2 type transport system ATP-binding protein
MPAEKPVIETDKLCKNFGPVKAVQDVNLKVKKGEIFALIGPNGAGKTTLIKMLTGLLKPDQGRVLICGFDIDREPVEVKACFGYVPDNPVVYDYLTGYEFLKLTGNLRGLGFAQISKRIGELVKIFPIGEILNYRMGSYSRGNRQKTAFLASLISEPQLLIIDEPIAGLDPTSITIFGETLKKFTKGGGAVFLATHILSFGQDYADRVGVMNKGKIIKEESKTGKSLEELYIEATEIS